MGYWEHGTPTLILQVTRAPSSFALPLVSAIESSPGQSSKSPHFLLLNILPTPTDSLLDLLINKIKSRDWGWSLSGVQ